MEKARIGSTIQLKDMTEEEIKRTVNRSDEAAWLEELREKSTIALYKQYKQAIGEKSYDNIFKSVLLFRAWTNTLRLNWRKFTDGEVRSVVWYMKCREFGAFLGV